MEFNGINNETNGIDGFERRLSERASAIDELMELVKSIGGRWERERRLIRRQQSIHSAIYWWMSWCGGGEENQSSGAPSSAHRCAASSSTNSFFSFSRCARRKEECCWRRVVFSSANWIYEICGLWALAPLCRERIPFHCFLSKQFHFISLALLLLNWREKTSCGSKFDLVY